jgi:3D (Asp-Asp-Asp) domain-containing protein
MQMKANRALKTLILLLVFFIVILVPNGTTAKSKKKIIGYEYKYVKVKVKIKKRKYLGKFYITHYCPCEECCGVGGGKVTASGTVPTAGRTVGVNPDIVPYGTKLQIGKQDGYVAEDTGGGIGTYHLDVFCNSHAEALAAGVGYKKVYAISYKYKKKKIKVKVPIYQITK